MATDKPQTYKNILEVIESLAIDGVLEVRPGIIRDAWDAVFPGKRPPSVQTITAQLQRMERDEVVSKSGSHWVLTDQPKVAPVVSKKDKPVEAESGWVVISPAHLGSNSVDYAVAVRNGVNNKTPSIVFSINKKVAPNADYLMVKINPEQGLLRFERTTSGGFKVSKRAANIVQFRVAGRQAVELNKLFKNIPGAPAVGTTAELTLVSERSGSVLEVQFA